VLIAKNTTVPTSKTQVFSTAADNQTSVEVHVLQGERPMAQDNKSLGRFILDGIPPSPRGIPQVEVSLDIDANGILSVTAKDKASGKSQSIRIEGSTGISDEEVERMKKEAELHAEEDKKKQEFIEARNTADTVLYTAEKTLKDAGDKVSEEITKEVTEKLEALKKVKDGDSIEDIKQATEALSQAMQKVGSAMYQQPQGTENKEQGAGETTNGQPSEDKPAQDAEVKSDTPKEGEGGDTPEEEKK
jgi:molecular chaperone DnaK